MIQSFEIQYPLSAYAASYCIFQLNYPRPSSKLVPQYRVNTWRKSQIDSFFKTPNNKNFNLLEDSDIQNRVPGILKILFLHSYDQGFIGDQYYIRIKINPCSLLLKCHSEELFCCTSTNIEALHVAYSKFIFTVFPHAFAEPIPLNYENCLNTGEYIVNKKTGEIIYRTKWLEKIRTLSALPYFGLASVKRIDYAMDLEQPKYFKNFLSLAKRSALDRRKTVSITNGKCELESKNKSRIFSVYEILENDDDPSSSLGIIRFKAIFRNPSKSWKKSNLKIGIEKDDIKFYSKVRGGLLPFLNEEVANDLINKEYNKLVGSGDFYSTYKAWKIIDGSKYKKDKKQNLKDIMCLISQCWSLQKAEKQYVEGASIKKSRKLVKGTQQTFRKSIQQLREMGLQPLRIPDSWHLSYIRNPVVDKISKVRDFAPQSLSKLLTKTTLEKYSYTIKEIERLLEARRIH